MGTTNKILWRDSLLFIGSSADGTLDIEADTVLNIGTDSLGTLNCGTAAGAATFGPNANIKLGSSGNQVGFFGGNGTFITAAYTQTFADVTRTHADPTALILTDSTGGTANQTLVAISGSGDDANINNNFADLVDEVNKLIADLANAKEILNQIIDDLQGYNLLQ